MNTIQQAENIINETKAMRSLQKSYFQSRDKRILEQSKLQEKKVDAMIDEYFKPKNTLF
jgi:hypothetical protein